MKAARVFTLRVPLEWYGRISSDAVRAMLADFLQHPVPLPADLGPGDARISLSLPERAVKVISGLLNDTESGALRRIIAHSFNMGLPSVPVINFLPETSAPTRSPSAASWPRALPAARPQYEVLSYPTAEQEKLAAPAHPHPAPRPRESSTRHSQDSASRYDFWADHPYLLAGVGGVIVIWLIWRIWKLWGASLAFTATAPQVSPAFKTWIPVG